MRALVEAGYRVINVDARNQGESAHTVRGCRMSRHAADLHELLQTLEISEVVLLGNSLGAATMFAFVSLFTDIKVKGVIDVDQSPKMVPDQTWQYGFKGLTWANFPSLLAEPMSSSTVQPLADATYAAVMAVDAAHPYDPELNLPLLFDHAVQDWRDVLVTMAAPLCVVAGGDSPYFEPAFAAAAAKLAKHGQAIVVPHSGHVVMAEQPVLFNQILFDFPDML